MQSQFPKDKVNFQGKSCSFVTGKTLYVYLCSLWRVNQMVKSLQKYNQQFNYQKIS